MPTYACRGGFGRISLRAGENGTAAGPVVERTGAANDVRVELSRRVDLINDRFGTQFTMADELFFEQVRTEAANAIVARRSGGCTASAPTRCLPMKACP